MLLGRIFGKVTTSRFSFRQDVRVKKLQYVAVKDLEGKWILGYVDSIEKYADHAIANVEIIGSRDQRGFLKLPSEPFEPDTPVFTADEELIRKTVGLQERGLYIGILDNYRIHVNIPIKHIFKHIAILSKTGGGKSYTAGVLLEEMAENGVSAVVIDPHGEYHSLTTRNSKHEEVKIMENFGITPKSYEDSVIIFGKNNPLKMDSKLTAEEISEMLRENLTSKYMELLYSAIKKLQGKNYTIKDIIDSLLTLDSHSKWGLVSILESLEKTKIFSANPTKLEDIVKPGKISIIDLKEIPQNIQQMIVMKLAKELFDARKRGLIPEFVFVIEEAHNFCPERSFGESPSSRIIRTIASEGRKFGLSLCVISQRPAKIDKNVLSQCNTQIILKVTNPNDLKAILDSVEGVTDSTKEEIMNLPIGVGLVVGVTEHPLLVDIRVRRSEHGGDTIKTVMTKTEKKVLMFAPKYFEKDIKKGYKGIEGAELIGYPLWKIKGLYEGLELEIYIDGITGELMFQEGQNIEFTKALKEILNLPQQQREILMYVMKEGPILIENISKDLKIPIDVAEKNIKSLLTKNYVIAEGEIFKINIDSIDPKKMCIKADIVLREEGVKIDARISSDTAKSIGEMLGIKILDIEPVYFPYWSIKTNKSRKFLINALNNKLDLQKSKIVSELI